MMRLPFYLIVCIASVSYLVLANTHGWDPVAFSQRASQGGSGGFYGGVHHK